MKMNKGKYVFALSILLGTVAANAATEIDAMQACTDAIATEIKDAQGADVRVRIDASTIDPDKVLHGLTVFHLDAVDASTNELVRKFDCQVNRRAKVRSLRTLSLDAPSAIERSRS